MLLGSVSLLLFTLSNQFVLLLVSRFFTGFFQVFVSIYYPVWADTFGGTEQRKTTWMSVLLLSSSFGVLLGYIGTAQFIKLGNWQYSFYFQVILALPLAMVLFLSPTHYLDTK